MSELGDLVVKVESSSSSSFLFFSTPISIFLNFPGENPPTPCKTKFPLNHFFQKMKSRKDFGLKVSLNRQIEEDSAANAREIDKFANGVKTLGRGKAKIDKTSKKLEGEANERDEST